MKRHIARLTAIALSLVGAAALTAAPANIAQSRLNPTGIDFVPLVDAARFVLTVSTPEGKVVRREFDAGEAITFSIGESREPLADGAYTWELTAAPRLKAGDRAKLDAARSAGDPNAIAEAQRAAGIRDGGWVQSGAFRVEDGTVLDAAASEPEHGLRNVTSEVSNVVAEDQVIPDDLIVQGSECVGVDCVNGEVFDYDTLRLKENNTRIQFNDTSVTTGYSTNNWQIRANSSASGGASFLGFVDQGTSGTSEAGTISFLVTAGAPADSIKVDSTGRVGFRTATPVLDLHVRTSNTPAMRLEQNNAGGFTAQTWDMGGNEANFFVRDVTGGSTYPFRVRPGAPTSSIDISTDGDVGVGTASPVGAMHVKRTLGASGVIMNLENNAQVQFRMKDTAQTPEWVFTASNAFQIDNLADAGVELQVDPNGTLRVNGTAMTVPDYVFDPDYELMPLDELANFVRTNRHLPDVPNQAEIREEGLNLSQFPLTLLEKIEQLTLYAVELQKQNTELAARVAELEAKSR